MLKLCIAMYTGKYFGMNKQTWKFKTSNKGCIKQCLTPNTIGGAFLTIEHPSNPADFKTSSQLFVISDKAKYCLLCLATLKDHGCVNEAFPDIAPLQVIFITLISLLLLHLQFFLN